MNAYLKFYDNGTSLEVGTNNETENVFFETRFANDEDSSCFVSLSKDELQELIEFLTKKVKNMD